MTSVAELTIQSLLANGITSLYGLPGYQLDPFFDAVYDRQDQLAVVHTRHEQGAAYMATGAALGTGKPQAYVVVPGSGFLNSTAALSTALATNSRVMALVGDIPTFAQGRGLGVLHEIPDGFGIMERLTKAAFQVGPEEPAATIDEAFNALTTGAPGPVGLSVPTNLWSAGAAATKTIAPAGSAGPDVDTDLIASAVELISKAKAPLIVVGGGAMDFGTDILRLADATGAAVVAFRNGQGVVSTEEPMRISMPVAHALWPKVDLVIGLGTRLHSQLSTWGHDDDLSIIHVTLNQIHLNNGVAADVGICADLSDVLPELLIAIEGTEAPNSLWREEVLNTKARVNTVIAAKLTRQIGWLDAIRAELPRDGILVDEITQMGYVSRFAYPVYGPRTLISPGYQATLGYGYATALGVAHARPDVPVVNFCGDGGAMFTLNEIATAMQHRINLTTIVFADGHFGNVRGLQRDNYQGRFIATELSNPDFAKYAEAFGAQGLRAATPEDLRTQLRVGMTHPGPKIIEVPVGEFASPWEFILLPKVRGV